MPAPFNFGPPGITTVNDALHRTIFLQFGNTFLAQGRLIDGTQSRDPGNSAGTADPGVLRAGLLMGLIATTPAIGGTIGRYAPSIIDVTQGAYTSGGTTLTVSPAGAAEIIRRVGSSGAGTLNVVGPPTANGTVAVTAMTFSAIVAATGVITCTSLGVNKVAGSFITCADGSQTPVSLIPDWDYGVQVVDVYGASIPAVDFPKMPISAVIHSLNILPVWPTDTSLQAWIVAGLNAAAGGQFVFDHIY